MLKRLVPTLTISSQCVVGPHWSTFRSHNIAIGRLLRLWWSIEEWSAIDTKKLKGTELMEVVSLDVNTRTLLRFRRVMDTILIG
jgi:hypothetical protein